MRWKNTKEKRLLRSRWKGQEERIQLILEDLRSGKDWTLRLLADESRKWQELPGVRNCPKRNPIEGSAAPKDLRGIRLRNVACVDVEGLADSYLDYAVFKSVDFSNSSMRGCSLRQSRMMKCTCDHVAFDFADLSYARCRGSLFDGACFSNADLSGADFREAVLQDVILSKVAIVEEPWWGFVVPWRWTHFGGLHQTVAEVDKSMHDFVEAENYKWGLIEKHPFWARLWYFACNCGRSPGRLAFVALLIWSSFGLIYSRFSLPSFLEGTVIGNLLCSLGPGLDWNGASVPHNWFEPFYFSGVVMTTLGFGEIVPDGGQGCTAQVVVTIQALLGYALLGMVVAMILQRAVKN